MPPIPKPSSCIGCPFYDKGKYYTPDKVIPGSKVSFILQNPGPDEEQGRKIIKTDWYSGRPIHSYTDVVPQPLIGATGKLFNERFLPLSGLNRNEISIHNTIRCRPGKSLGLRADSLPTVTNKMSLFHSEAAIVRAINHCRDAHLKLPSTTELVVLMGGYSLYSMTGLTDVTSWRGYAFNADSDFNPPSVDSNRYNSLVSKKKLFVTMHLAALFQRGKDDGTETYDSSNSKYYHATLQDFGKIKRILNGKWPRPLPTWRDMPPVTWPKYSSFDTEYHPDTNELYRWSLCDTAYNLYCVEAYNTPLSGIPIAPGSTVIAQQVLADWPHLKTIVDVSSIRIEDLMLANCVLHTGEPNDLDYQCSVHGAFNRYKHLSKQHPQLYSALDSYEPMFIWKNAYVPRFRKDPLAWDIYRQDKMKLVNMIDKTQQKGIPLDQERLTIAGRVYTERIEEIRQLARVLTGNPNFNIGGTKGMKEALYGIKS
jgi:uracil-DNA glycosylase